MKLVDLHIHTIFSDGTLSPHEVVRLAASKGLSAIAITDHDELSGLPDATEAGNQFGISIISGVELSGRLKDKSVHILGYFVDKENRELINFIQSMKQSRFDRAEKIVEKLNEHGIYITIDDIKIRSGLGGIGRLHIAETLMDAGVVKDTHEAFSKYIGYGKSCYVSKSNISTKFVIELIIKAGGIPVIAHPSLHDTEDLISELINEGIMGIEVWYPTHSESQVKKYLEIAKKYRLVPTGGSDSHGTRPGYPGIGEFTIPYDVLDRLIEAKNRI
ncbi:MAG: PHP domain-containing protein [bacterium]|nr:PHP domain-containing protein [bacterium]